jgi:hypothetical protein
MTDTKVNSFNAGLPPVTKIERWRQRYARLDSFGILSHFGAAVCAIYGLVADLDSITVNDGLGVLLLCSSRLLREINSLKGAVEDSQEKLEEAGFLDPSYFRILCAPINFVRKLLSVALVAGLLSFAGLVASLLDAFNEAHPGGSIGLILLAINDIVELVEESREADNWPWQRCVPQANRDALHLLLVFSATAFGIWEVVGTWGDSGGLGAQFGIILLSVSKILSKLGFLFGRIKSAILGGEDGSKSEKLVDDDDDEEDIKAIV